MFFFYVILWKGNVERLNLNRPYYQSRGGGGSKKEKKEGGKKGEGTPSSLSYSLKLNANSIFNLIF